MRFANLNTKDTLKIYQTNEKSLSAYRSKNKYGFVNFPDERFRLKADEIQGSEAIEAEKKL